MTRTFLLASLIVAAVALMGMPASAAGAASCESTLLGALGTTLPNDNFQAADGDQCSPADGGPGGVGATDWHDLAAVGDALSGDNGATLADNSTATIADLGSLSSDPSVFGCQTAAPKELTPSGWCWSPSSLQDKSNVITAWVNKRVVENATTGIPDLFVRFGFGRIGTQGSVNLDVEFNHRSDLYHNPLGFDVPNRSGDGNPVTSDMLLSFDWNGGAAQITRCFWNGTAASGTWVSASNPNTDCDNSAGSPDILDTSEAIAAVNDWDSHADEPITNWLPGGDFNLSGGSRLGAMLDGQFGEADVNVTKALGLSTAHPCASFGSVFMHSRSSTAITSDPKDWVTPVAIPLTNCATIKIAKTTDPADPTQSNRFAFSGSANLAYDAVKDTNVGSDSGWSGTAPANTNTSFQLADGTDRTIENVLPGTYTVTEDVADAAGKGYTLSHLDCGDAATGVSTITVHPGDNVTCSYVNSRLPTLTVKKAVTNDDGGTAAPSDFNLHVTTGGADVSGSPAAGSATGTTYTLAPGTYSVSEDSHAGYLGSISGDCATDGSVSLKYGDHATCTITNDDVAALLTVIKHVDNQGTSGGKSASDFTMNVTANNPTDDSFPGDEAGTTVGVGVGSYSVEEGSHAGYRESRSAGCSGSLALAEHATCTITNTRIVPKLIVVKSAQQDHAYDGDTLGYKYDVTNAGNGPLTSVALTDTVNGHSGCTAFQGPTGDDGDGVLSPGETWHYTCSTGFSHGDEVAIGGRSTIENVVTATAKDEEGNPVTSAPAKADVPIYHPAIAIQKAGPPGAEPGDQIAYTLNITNPGDEAFAESTVKVTDPKCDAIAVTLVTKNDDPTPTSFDPGDMWTYTCALSAPTGQPLVHNDAFVEAADQFGKVVNGTSGVDTLLVLAEVFGNARAQAPTGCVARAFSARVLGTHIARVVFFVDGKRVKTLTKPTSKVGLTQVFAQRINPRALRIGVHRIVMRATYEAGVSNKPKTVTFKRSFQRCGKRLVAPRFTG